MEEEHTMALPRLILAARGIPGGPLSIVDFLTHPGEVFYVSSVTGNDAWAGNDPSAPLATIAAALAKCSDGRGDVIYVLPYHNEGFGNAQLSIDIDDVAIIGLGRGEARPRIDFDHANASIDIKSNNVHLENFTLLPSVTDVLIGIDINAAALRTTLVDIEGLPGEDGAGVDDFAVMIELKAGCTGTRCFGVRERSHASAAGYASCIHLKGQSDDVEIYDLKAYLYGAALIAAVNGDTTLSLNLQIEKVRGYLDAEPIVEVLTGTTGWIKDAIVVSDLATLNAGIVADAMGRFDCKISEVNEAGGVIGTVTIDD
jgi:hypothetical protein